MMAEKKTNTANYNMDPEFLSLMEDEVSKVKTKRVPIARAFEEIAKRTGLKINTVRNYYYRYINDQNFQEKKNQPYIKSSFTKDETVRLISRMLELQGQGLSVRAASSKLAKGNQKVLLRNQNKYRNTIAKETALVEAIIKDLEHKNVVHMNPYTRKLFVPMHAAVTPLQAVQAKENDMTLIELIGQLTSNLEKIKSGGTYKLIDSLVELSKIAAQNSVQESMTEEAQERIVKLETQLREVSTTKLLQQQRIEALENKIKQLTKDLNTFKDISGSFLNLSQTEKITQLPNYVHQLNGYIAKN